MVKNTKLSPSEKVKIPIQGEDKISPPKKEHLVASGFKLPQIDITLLKTALLLVGAPIISILAALYLLGLVVSFILYPVRFFALILSVLLSLLKFIF